MNTLMGLNKPSITDEEKRDDLINLTAHWLIEDPDPEKVRTRLRKVWNHGLNTGKRQKQEQIEKVISEMKI